MGLFDIFGGQTQQAPQQRPQMDPRQMQQQIRRDVDDISSHPASYLKAKGYNIPENMTDARQITQYLLQTKQIGIPRLQQAASLFGWTPGRR